MDDLKISTYTALVGIIEDHDVLCDTIIFDEI